MADRFIRYTNGGQILLKTPQGYLGISNGLPSYAGASPADDGALQLGLKWPTPYFKDLGDGWVLDYRTGLQWPKTPHLLIPGAIGVTSDNMIARAMGPWATGTGYLAGDMVMGNLTEFNASDLCTSLTNKITITSGSITFDTTGYSDEGIYIEISGKSQYRTYDVQDDTRIFVSPNPTTTVVGTQFRKVSGFVCVVPHTSGGTTFAADLAANPTYWRQTKLIKNADSLDELSQAIISFIGYNGITWVCAFYDLIAEMNGTGGLAGHANMFVPNQGQMKSLCTGMTSPTIQSPFVNYVSGTNWLTSSEDDPGIHNGFSVGDTYGIVSTVALSTATTALSFYLWPCTGGHK